MMRPILSAQAAEMLRAVGLRVAVRKMGSGRGYAVSLRGPGRKRVDWNSINIRSR
jgi:hypothetical protein